MWGGPFRFTAFFMGSDGGTDLKKEFLECGRIVAPHGVRGEVRIEPWCDPGFLTEFHTLYMEGKPVRVTAARVQKNMNVLKLEGVDSREKAIALRGKILFLHRADARLEEGEYFVQDLIDCQVVDMDTGADYGKVYDVRPTGANDVYYLRDQQGKERLVPAIPEVVLEKDIDRGIIKIRPLEGLFDAD